MATSVRCFALALLLCATPVAAQHVHHPPTAPDSTRRVAAPKPARPTPRATRPARRAPARAGSHAGHPTRREAPRATHTDAGAHTTHVVPAMYGPWPMTREASGTAWQPDATPHEGRHGMRGPWSLMMHGFVTAIWNDQHGPRGADEGMSTSMFMLMAQRPLGAGRLGFRGMLSAEPATLGPDGYALLLQTGETADGEAELIDRQHPHDLFMELAASYAVVDDTRSAFVYFGLPGEPALGPPTFMHRFTGIEFPDSPISHHWLDSTHITFGVLTLGAASGGVKLEGSVFTGREPDEHRWNLESPRFDSRSLRLGWNPTPAWSLQASHGWIESPEKLHPETDVRRSTASVMWAGGDGRRTWGATLAWGRNRNEPGRFLDAWLLEGRATLGRHTLLGRAEGVDKDELFPEDDPLHGREFRVGKLSAGYVVDVLHRAPVVLGIGAVGSVLALPDDLEPVYGERPTAVMLFARAALR